MTVQRIVTPERYIGLTGDPRPTNVRSGATFYAYDTDLMYITYDGGTTWVAKDKKDIIGKLAANSGVNIGDVGTVLTSVSTATTTKQAIGSSNTQVIVSNASRKFAVFVNDSDEVIYLDLSATAVMNEGIRLNAAGGSYEINLNNLYTGEVSAICASGSKNLTVTEG